MNSSKNHKDITIVIVLYCESYDLVFETLNYLGSFKKIIIDNSNNINLKKKIENNFRIDQYILNKKNNGFSAGHNQGIKLSSTKYTMLLGPDCIIKEKDILNLIDVLINNENCFIVAPTSYDKKMNLTYTGGPLPENGDKNIVLNLSGNVCIQSVLGACMLFQTKKLIDSGLLFDENFFLYFSDDDLCRRVSKIGNHIIQSFNSKCIHQHGNIKIKNIFIKKFIREYNFTFDKFYYYLKINKHHELMSNFQKKIPSYIIKLILKIVLFNYVSALGIFARLFAYYKFRTKFFGRDGRVA
jgi:N-acetylglucosaminyl-diphospho-decaprenol L-rhamnosyltransferase